MHIYTLYIILFQNKNISCQVPFKLKLQRKSTNIEQAFEEKKMFFCPNFANSILNLIFFRTFSLTCLYFALFGQILYGFRNIKMLFSQFFGSIF